MKRKPSNQQLTSEIPFKQATKRTRSPNHLKKARPKFENQILSFLGPQRSKHVKAKEEYPKGEGKGDSHNSTASCTFSRSRLPKSRKNKQKEEKVKKPDNLSQKEIMEIINNFAIKIQRQWRVHRMRKHFKELINSEMKKQRKSQSKNSCPEVSAFEKLKFDQNKIKHLSYLTENAEEIVSSYNLQKYEQYEHSSFTNSKEINNDPLSYRSQTSSDKNSIRLDNDALENTKKRSAIALPKNNFLENNLNNMKEKSKQDKKQKKQSTSKIGSSIQIQQPIEKEERRVSYDSCQLQKKTNLENRRRSTGDLLFETREAKSFQIDKAFEIKITQEAPLSNNSFKAKKAIENSPVKRGEDEREAFNIKYPFDKALKHKRRQIEDYKQRKLLSIESRFKRKEVTERSYLQICRKINQQHDNRLEYFKEREGEIRSNWCKLLALSKENKVNSKYLEDDHDHNSISNIDASVSFDRWDFNSSAKKSLDGNLLEFAQGQHSKNYSLESVLKYLEDEETEKQNDEKKFRKNKSRQVIEAIAERSKEISDKSVEEFHEHPTNKIIAQTQKYQILEEAIQIQEEHTSQNQEEHTSQNQEESDRLNVSEQKAKANVDECVSDKQSQHNSINLEESECERMCDSSSKKKIEGKCQSQSLLISQIEAASPSDHIYSDKEIVQSAEKTILKELLFKNLQSDQKENKNSAILDRFIQLVNEKLVLSNIKLINSIKFMFAKMGEEKKQQRAKALTKIPPIQSDISAINTWLLQISHFILDNYQSVVRDNLIIIKQPPGLELLALAHKNISYANIYETVPEYVFKDFQFYYIKTLARNYGIGAQKYDAFSTLLYTFHRSLIDSLNLALTEELLTGRRWLSLPWSSQFKQKKRIIGQHAKICLERSINVVSNWAEYSLGRLQYDDEIAELEGKQYEEEKINLVCREQILDFTLAPAFTEANMLLSIANLIFDSEITNAYNDIFS